MEQNVGKPMRKLKWAKRYRLPTMEEVKEEYKLNPQDFNTEKWILCTDENCKWIILDLAENSWGYLNGTSFTDVRCVREVAE